jgi:SAM-dependent methyltransferase
MDSLEINKNWHLLADSYEHTDCPLCSSPLKMKLYHLTTPFRVVTCSDCGFHYLDPRLKESNMLELYGDDSYFCNQAVGYSDYEKQENALRLTFKRFLKTLHTKGFTGGSLLEIGAGYGFFLDEAREYFDFRAGTEMSRTAAEHAASRVDLLVHGGIDKLDKGVDFDCIVLSHVLEHIYQPRNFLESIMKHLKPDGKLIIVTPDMGNFWRLIMRSSWPSFKVPEHVLFFDSNSLVRLLKSCGFREMYSLPYPHAFPLKLVASKLNMVLPELIGSHNLWLPRTSLAICASAYA